MGFHKIYGSFENGSNIALFWMQNSYAYSQIAITLESKVAKAKAWSAGTRWLARRRALLVMCLVGADFSTIRTLAFLWKQTQMPFRIARFHLNANKNCTWAGSCMSFAEMSFYVLFAFHPKLSSCPFAMAESSCRTFKALTLTLKYITHC